ncbi:MAG TPA: DUF99 family protein [Nitrosopumilaceae archaeon]|nr:DUF99 family protein [Nitrosopumilaceae archaeon]
MIDGFVFGNIKINGDVTTETILQLHERLKRPDIIYVLISGLIIFLYDIVDIKKIFKLLKILIIGLTCHDSDGIEYSIQKHFPDSYNSKIKNCQNLDVYFFIYFTSFLRCFCEKEILYIQ